MTLAPMTPTDLVRHDLVSLAYDIDRARSSEAASEAYFLARGCFYGAPKHVQYDDGVAHAWALVVSAYGLWLDRHPTPIEPLVSFS